MRTEDFAKCLIPFHVLTGCNPNSCFFGNGKMSLYEKILRPATSSQSVGKAFHWMMMSWMTSSPCYPLHLWRHTKFLSESSPCNQVEKTKEEIFDAFASWWWQSWAAYQTCQLFGLHSAPPWSEETPLSYRSWLGIGEWPLQTSALHKTCSSNFTSSPINTTGWLWLWLWGQFRVWIWSCIWWVDEPWIRLNTTFILHYLIYMHYITYWAKFTLTEHPITKITSEMDSLTSN